MTKSLQDVKSDMSALYEELRAGQIDIKTASELANITGKYLKAVQLDLAQEMFIDSKARQLENRNGR